MDKKLQLCILGNLIDQNLVEIPFAKEPERFILNFLKENIFSIIDKNRLIEYEQDYFKKEKPDSLEDNDFLFYISEDIFDYNKSNTIIEEYLLSIPIGRSQFDSVTKIVIDVDNPVYKLIIPNWDGETPKDFLIESWDGIEQCENLIDIKVNGVLINKEMGNWDRLFSLPNIKQVEVNGADIHLSESKFHILEEYLKAKGILKLNKKRIKNSTEFIDISELNENLRQITLYIDSGAFERALRIINASIKNSKDNDSKIAYLTRKAAFYNDYIKKEIIREQNRLNNFRFSGKLDQRQFLNFSVLIEVEKDSGELNLDLSFSLQECKLQEIRLEVIDSALIRNIENQPEKGKYQLLMDAYYEDYRIIVQGIIRLIETNVYEQHLALLNSKDVKSRNFLSNQIKNAKALVKKETEIAIRYRAEMVEKRFPINSRFDQRRITQTIYYLIAVNKQEQIEEMLDLISEQYVYGAIYRWEYYLDRSMFVRGIDSLLNSKHLLLLNLYDGALLNVVKGIQPILGMFNCNESKIQEIQKPENLKLFRANFASFLTDVKNCYFKKLSLAELKSNEKYSIYLNLYTH